MDNWLSTEDMSEIHDVSQSSLNVFAFSHRDSIYVKKTKIGNFFNETELLKIQNRRLKMWSQSHKNYYRLKLERKMPDTVQARGVMELTGIGNIASWSAYLSNGMWCSLIDFSVTKIHLSTYLMAYYEWSCLELSEKVSDLTGFENVDSYPEVDLTGFDSIDMYHDYWEMKKAHDRIVA